MVVDVESLTVDTNLGGHTKVDKGIEGVGGVAWWINENKCKRNSWDGGGGPGSMGVSSSDFGGVGVDQLS